MSWKDVIGRERDYCQAFEGRDDIIQWDVLSIKNEQLIKVTFIKTNSKFKQGVRLAIDAGEGYIEVLGQKSKGIKLWEDTAPKEIICKCHSSEGLLSIYNVWDEGEGFDSLADTSGMIIKEEGNKFTYHCNDWGYDTNFDKLIFTIEKL